MPDPKGQHFPVRLQFPYIENQMYLICFVNKITKVINYDIKLRVSEKSMHLRNNKF